jgi:hypothetical protein
MKDTIIQNLQIKLHKENNDSVNVNLLDKKIEVANETIQINQLKNTYDYAYDFLTGFGILLSAILSVISIRKLIKKDDQKQGQIDELINQTKELAKHNTLYERRIRMINKPRIISGGGTTAGYAEEWSIRLENKGENAIITNIEIIGGDKDHAVFLTNGLPYELDKGKTSLFSGRSIDKNPNQLYLQICVSYKDVEDYEYQAIFDWKGGGTTLIETKEL